MPLSLSVLAHTALLVALLTLWISRPIVLPPPKSIDVQVLSERDYQRVTVPPQRVPPTSVPAPTTAPTTLATPVSEAPTTPAKPTPQLPPSATTQGMTHATTLFSAALLKEPASREVRATLPTLDRYERITQLCNIESTEQIRRAIKSSNPDTVSAAAFDDTTLTGLTMTAHGAAYRSKRNWYALTFDCTVLPDLSGVADYSFETGAAIPKDQ